VLLVELDEEVDDEVDEVLDALEDESFPDSTGGVGAFGTGELGVICRATLLRTM